MKVDLDWLRSQYTRPQLTALLRTSRGHAKHLRSGFRPLSPAFAFLIARDKGVEIESFASADPADTPDPVPFTLDCGGLHVRLDLATAAIPTLEFCRRVGISYYQYFRVRRSPHYTGPASTLFALARHFGVSVESLVKVVEYK